MTKSDSVKNKGASEDIFSAYIKQIKHFPLLSFEEELELSRRIQQGDESARQKLIESNLRLVVKIARNYVMPDVQLMDLVQEGNMGLIHAAQKYDYNRNVRFSTYANWWIKQSISRALSNKRRTIRIPHRKEELIRRIQHVYQSLSQVLMRQPAIDEIAAEICVSPDEVKRAIRLINNTVSLEMDSGYMDAVPLMELYEDYTYSPETAFIKKSVCDFARRSLNCLKEHEKRIVVYRYQLESSERYTLKKISAKMGISPETVRQIEIRALRKMKNNADACQWMMYSAAVKPTAI